MASGVPTCAKRWATAALSLLPLVACPRIVRAQERLAVPASCGSEAELAREIAALRLGREPSPAPEVLARGLYAPRRSHFRIRGQGDVYTTSGLGAQLGLVLAWPTGATSSPTHWAR